MSANLRSVRQDLSKSLEYQNIKRELDNLPSNIKNYIAKNFQGAEGVQMVADIAGMFDPTPVSDLVGALTAIWRFDWLSLGTSVLGMIPYLGDTGKLGKWALRAATDKRYKYVVAVMNKYTRLRRQMALLAQTKALQKTRKQMWDYYQRHKKGDDCALCKAAGKSVKLPKTGTWKPGPPGEPGSKWFPDANTPMSQDMKDLIAKKGGVPYHEGMPDYSDFARELPPKGSGQTTMPIEMTGRQSDISNSYKQYYDMMDVNGTPMSRADRIKLEKETTWHHTDRGMQLVPKTLHNPAQGGPSHVGARSWLNWSEY
jgi:hypothetical protein